MATYKVPRPIAFSASQKRQQILEKRARKRASQDDAINLSMKDDDGDDYDRVDKLSYRHRPKRDQTTLDRDSISSGDNQSNPSTSNTKSKRDLNSVFAKIPHSIITARRQESQKPFTRLPKTSLEVDLQVLYPPNKPPPEIPKRPQWTYDETKTKLDEQEHAAFYEWMRKLTEEYPGDQLSWYEQNLEVWRQLWRVVEISDIILCLVDSRHPVLQFSPRLYEWVVKELGKKLTLVINKADLVDSRTTQAWSEYFQKLYPDMRTVSFACYNKSGRSRLLPTAQGVAAVLESCRNTGIDKPGIEKIDWDALIAEAEERVKKEEALDRLKEARREGELSEDIFLGRSRRSQRLHVSDGDEADLRDKTGEGNNMNEKVNRTDDDFQELLQNADNHSGVLTIGLIGHPNVGKSSLLNSIIGKKVVSVSKTAGHTKHFQTIFIGPHVRLADCPGLVFPSLLPKSLQILSGMYKLAQVQEPYSCIQYLAERIPLEQLLKLDPPEDAPESGYQWSVWDICEQFAIKSGLLVARSALPDIHRAANVILNMTCDGKILLSLKPPGFYSHDENNFVLSMNS